MDFNFDYNLVQTQKLLLTPQLKEAVNVLGMYSEELFGYVESQLETNPVIDLSETEEKYKKEAYSNNGDNWESETEIIEENHDDIEQESYIGLNEAAERLNLKEYMLIQLHSSGISGDRLKIGEYLIDNLDENGYLKSSPNEAAFYFKKSMAEVIEVLELLQSFEPTGICSRSLKECLTAQLRQMGCEDSDAFVVVDGYLDDLAANRMNKICRQTGIKKGRLEEIVSLIKSLEPKPGRDFYPKAEPRVQIPDVIVREINGLYKPLLNEDAFPAVNISNFYKQLASAADTDDACKYLQTKLNNALWLIKCIEQRKTILINIASCIIDSNRNFFRKGRKYINPGALEEVADKLNIHESIMKKAVNRKYLLCAWGVFEYEEFFV